MSLVPLLVINAVLLIITVLLLIADRFLVTYGSCKITVVQGDEKQTLQVQGGNYLLSDLTSNGIKVTSSCGGKATCGYCKVKILNGAGPLLPTEEIFMSREEKKLGMRIACAVKVKNDMEIVIPDFLSTVRSIVKNNKFDPKLRWNFVTSAPKPAAIYKNSSPDESTSQTISEIIDKHSGSRGALSPILQVINEQFKYLPNQALSAISEKLNIPLATVFRTATFYSAFSLKPRGKNIISVCLGTACHVKGAADVMSALEDELKIKAGETTEDMNFTLEGVRCIGCCGLAPVIKVGEEIHGLMTRKKVPKLIEQYRNT